MVGSELNHNMLCWPISGMQAHVLCHDLDVQLWARWVCQNPISATHVTNPLLIMTSTILSLELAFRVELGLIHYQFLYNHCLDVISAGVRADVENLISETCGANINRFISDKSRTINRKSVPELFIDFLRKVHFFSFLIVYCWYQRKTLVICSLHLTSVKYQWEVVVIDIVLYF